LLNLFLFMIHELKSAQFIPASPTKVWDYFSTPKNLNEITPPSMHFEIKGEPGAMYTGQMIAYRIQVIPGLKINWLTEIRHVQEGVCFVDEQRIGPYKLWYHEHRFTAHEGGVMMTDKVTYTMKFGFLGELVRILWVKRQLKYIFDYRRKKVTEIFG
jgi:ligand-binding SRPBCC domain-containing protein